MSLETILIESWLDGLWL